MDLIGPASLDERGGAHRHGDPRRVGASQCRDGCRDAVIVEERVSRDENGSRLE
jgi:hypothetical protein